MNESEIEQYKKLKVRSIPSEEQKNMTDEEFSKKIGEIHDYLFPTGTCDCWGDEID